MQWILLFLLNFVDWFAQSGFGFDLGIWTKWLEHFSRKLLPIWTFFETDLRQTHNVFEVFIQGAAWFAKEISLLVNYFHLINHHSKARKASFANSSFFKELRSNY